MPANLAAYQCQLKDVTYFNKSYTQQTAAGERCSPLRIIRASLLCRKIASLFADFTLCYGMEKAVQSFVLRHRFVLFFTFICFLTFFCTACRLTPIEALPQAPLGALPLDPTSPLAPGLSVRFISRFARCFILLYACNLLWSAMLISHSSLPISDFSLLIAHCLNALAAHKNLWYNTLTRLSG